MTCIVNNKIFSNVPDSDDAFGFVLTQLGYAWVFGRLLISGFLSNPLLPVYHIQFQWKRLWRNHFSMSNVLRMSGLMEYQLCKTVFLSEALHKRVSRPDVNKNDLHCTWIMRTIEEDRCLAVWCFLLCIVLSVFNGLWIEITTCYTMIWCMLNTQSRHNTNNMSSGLSVVLCMKVRLSHVKHATREHYEQNSLLLVKEKCCFLFYFLFWCMPIAHNRTVLQFVNTKFFEKFLLP